MSYNPNIPQPNDELSDSQPDILNNFGSSNTSFGIDHYPFSDLTVNNGKHNKVTTPLIVGGIHPTTIAAEPKFYAMQDTVNIGVIQYSRGPSDAVPTPVTSLQSTAAAIVLASTATTNVLDFTGLPRAMATLSAFDSINISTGVVISNIFWNGTIFQIGSPGTALKVQASGNIIQLKNQTVTPMSIYWTLELKRLS